MGLIFMVFFELSFECLRRQVLEETTMMIVGSSAFKHVIEMIVLAIYGLFWFLPNFEEKLS